MFLQVLKELHGGFRRIGVTEIRSGNPLDDDWSSSREVPKLGVPYSNGTKQLVTQIGSTQTGLGH